MSPDTPLTAAPTEPALLMPDPDFGEFRVASSVEIGAILRSLLETQTLVTLRSASGEGSPMVSRVCTVELNSGTLGLEVPVGGIPAGSLQGELTCEAYIESIRVQFELAAPTTRGRGLDAMLISALPALVYRFQRRRAFRVKPHSRAPHADLTPLAEVTPMDGQGRYRLRILDISMGGLALLVPPGTLVWPAGQLFSAHIELDRHSQFNAHLRMQHAHPSDPELGTQIGCAFSRLDPDGERTLQRYIDHTQKLDRLMRKG